MCTVTQNTPSLRKSNFHQKWTWRQEPTMFVGNPISYTINSPRFTCAVLLQHTYDCIPSEYNFFPLAFNRSGQPKTTRLQFFPPAYKCALLAHTLYRVFFSQTFKLVTQRYRFADH